MLRCQPQQKSILAAELEKNDNVQLVLTPEQRQHLIGFLLLIESDPLILTQICLYLRISRSTVISDLDQVEAWFHEWGIELQRRQNFGICINCSEKQRQQVLLALIWGKSPFQPSIFKVSFQNGLTFSLAEDIQSMPMIKDVNDFLHLFNMKKIFNKVIFIEDFLGGRFTDEAVLYLALVFSILLARIKMGSHIQLSDEELNIFRNTQEWKAAEKMVNNLEPYEAPLWGKCDIAYVVMHIISAPLLENWIGDLDREGKYRDLFDGMMDVIDASYQIEGMIEDPTLRDGIVNYLIPMFNHTPAIFGSPRPRLIFR
jgi:transcriptional antiterminator